MQKETVLDELRTAMDNVKTLSGLLPVCSSCRNVRDDKGYWSRIEEFMSAHSDVEISRSICPECSKKAYPEKPAVERAIPNLSKREKEVISWIRQGKHTWEISQILKISESTVKFHVSKIMRKLDVSSRPQAVSVALELGVLDKKPDLFPPE